MGSEMCIRDRNGTSKMGLCYKGLNVASVVGYSDSDWAGDVCDRKSTSAYVLMMSGAAVSWCSESRQLQQHQVVKQSMWL